MIMSRTNKQLIPLYLILGGFLVLTPAVSSLAAAAVPYSGHFQSSSGGTYGTIASIQGGGDTTHPTWILSGHWGTNLINKTVQDFNQTNPARFDASFTMVLLNGSAKHSHHISNFSLTNVNDENDTLSYTGLATVTLRAGPMKDVPVEIKVFNHNVISIWFDPTKVNSHFGQSPIYGTVLNKKDMEDKGPISPHKGNMTLMGKSW
jgi:hypothetical protein